MEVEKNLEGDYLLSTQNYIPEVTVFNGLAGRQIFKKLHWILVTSRTGAKGRHYPGHQTLIDPIYRNILYIVLILQVV